MKRSTSLFASLSLIAMLSGTAFAQDNPQPQPQPGQGQGQGQGQDGQGQDGQRRQRGQRGQRGGRGFGMDVEQMKKDLGLSDEQVTKIKAFQEEQLKSREEMMKKMREGGGDRNAMREAFRSAMEEGRKKMEEILTPEQNKKWQEQMQNRFRGGRGGRGERGDRGGGREVNFQRLRDEALKALKLSEEESAVLVPLLDGVFETRKLLVAEQDKRRNAFLEKVRATTGETELAALLKKYREDRDQDKETLKKAQKKLVEALTPEQEALLVAMNILD
ncbi:MAG: Spy/CpxP family protein refolding chaperone [Planctomycetota bacterium]